MLRLPMFLGLCAGLTLGTAASGAPKIISDPAEDPRLRAPITLERGKTPLSSLLSQIGAQAKVSMAAAPEAADEPAILFVHGLPAQEVMKRIAAHFNFRWKGTERADGFQWELYQDLKSRQEEEALRRGRQDGALRALLASLEVRTRLARRPAQELLAAADRFDDARQVDNQAVERLPRTPEFQLMRRERSSDGLRELAASSTAPLLELIQNLPPTAWEQLAASLPLRFSSQEEPGFTRLDARWTDKLRAATPLMRPPGSRVRFADPDGAETFARLEDLMQDQWRRARAYRVRLLLDMEGEGSTRRARLRVQVHTVMPPDFGGEQHMGGPQWEVEGRAEEQEAADTSETVRDALLDRAEVWQPVLLAKVAGERKVDWLNVELAAAARLYRINLIADAYRHARYSRPEAPEGKPLPLREWLRIHASPISHWERKGQWLTVRRRRWFDERLEEIPERTLERWEHRLRARPSFSPDDFGRLVLELRDEQLVHFPALMRQRGLEIEGLAFEAGGLDRCFIRTWASLSGSQRELLRAGGEVPFRNMPPEARAWLEIFQARETREQEVPDSVPLSATTLAALLVERRVTREGDQFLVDLIEGGRLMSRRPLPAAATRPKDGPVRDAVFVIRKPDGGLRYFYLVPPAVWVLDDRPAAAPTP